MPPTPQYPPRLEGGYHNQTLGNRLPVVTPTLAACTSALRGTPDPRLHSQAPASSCFISSFSGMSWMAALIFSRMTSTWLCHFRLQCLLSTSQSARQMRGREKQGVSWERDPGCVWGLTRRGLLPPSGCPAMEAESRGPGRGDKHRDKAPDLGRAGGEREGRWGVTPLLSGLGQPNTTPRGAALGP